MTIFPPPLNFKAVDEPDVYRAVCGFIETFGLPAMLPAPKTGRIFRGWSNRMSLPHDNEYAVMSVISHSRRGTNVEHYDASQAAIDEDGILTTSELIFCDVQIDFCSDPHGGRDYARRRAQAIETAARSSIAPQFFAGYGMSCLYATDARDLSFVGDAQQYVSRWMTVITLSFVTTVSADLPWFDAVRLKRLENVDVHHPPAD